MHRGLGLKSRLKLSKSQNTFSAIFILLCSSGKMCIMNMWWHNFKVVIYDESSRMPCTWLCLGVEGWLVPPFPLGVIWIGLLISLFVIRGDPFIFIRVWFYHATYSCRSFVKSTTKWSTIKRGSCLAFTIPRYCTEY